MRPPRPIWYPDSIEETQGVENVVGYPFPINKPIKQVWNPISRFGCTIGLELDKNRRNVVLRYVHSSYDNVESFAELTPIMNHQLRKVGQMSR